MQRFGHLTSRIYFLMNKIEKKITRLNITHYKILEIIIISKNTSAHYTNILIITHTHTTPHTLT